MVKEAIIAKLLEEKAYYERLGWLYCRIRWKDDNMEQDDVIALSNRVEDEYSVYFSQSVDALIKEMKDDTLAFDIIKIYDRK